MNDGVHYTQSFQNGIDRLFSLIPQIIGVLLLLIIGWFFASIVKRLVRAILRKLRFERSITLSPAGNYVTRVIEHPTEFVSKIAWWIVFLAFLSFAISSLNVPALNLMIYGVYKYIPNVIAAIIIFLVASAITIGAEAFIQKMFRSSPFSKVLGAIVPAIIMPIAIFMILNQLKIATDIVNITYTALMGSVALGLALAFGLGGRDVASRILEQAYSSAQLNSGQMRDEMLHAASNTRQQARNARSKAQDQMQQ
jgi:small-conductance mechanosensitive channel